MDTDSLAYLRRKIHEGVITVTFKKINGDIRVMDCTTNTDFIPPSAWPSGKQTISEDAQERTIRVYDVKAQGWRSFVADNVIEILFPVKAH
jgi:hypothetical protein